MKTIFIIGTTHGGTIFSIVYMAAFLTAAGIMIFSGVRRRYPLSSWLLILMTGILFFIIGEKCTTFSKEQWINFLSTFWIPETDGKNAFGGVIGLFAGLLIARYFLKFRRPVFDTMAIALPVALAISKLGCFLAGCCFGLPSGLPWAVCYDAASPAWHAHLAAGLIGPHAHASLPVHPVQLYQFAGCLAIAVTAWRTRKFWRSGGSLFIFSMLCYGVLLIITEFLSQPEPSSLAGRITWGLNGIQWVTLAALLPGILSLFLLESKAVKGEKHLRTQKIKGVRENMLLAGLCLITLAGRNWFTNLEMVTLSLFLIPVILVVFIRIWREHSVAGFRWVTPLSIIFCFGFMSQTSSIKSGSSDRLAFTEVGAVGMMGKFSAELQQISIAESCSGRSYTYNTIDKKSVPYYQVGFNTSYNVWHGDYKKISVGGRVFYGEELPDQMPLYPGPRSIYGVSPFVNFDWHYFGLKTGFTVGQMKWQIRKPETRLSDDEVIVRGYSKTNILPAVAIRVGSSDKFFGEASFPGMFPSSSPFELFHIGMGTGFWKTNGTKAVVGFWKDGFYTQLVYPIQNKVVLEGYYADNFCTGNSATRAFGLGIHFRIFTSGKVAE